jgi:hypothetical protein
VYIGFRKDIGGKQYRSRGYVAARYERCSKTIKRWEDDPKVNFPAPDLVVNDRDYWTDETLDAFDARRAEEQAAEAPVE